MEKLTLRFAVRDDIDAIKDLYADYDFSGTYDMIQIDLDRVTQVMINSIPSKGVILAHSRIGELIGCVVVNVLKDFVNSDAVAQAVYLFVKPGFREFTRLFILKLEELVKSFGPKWLVFTIPGNAEKSEKHKRFYSMIGYGQIETVFGKAINDG